MNVNTRCRIPDVDRSDVRDVCAVLGLRDVSGSRFLNKSAPTPASKMMTGPGASTANSENNAYNARAEAGAAGTRRRHFRDANASMTGGSAPANTGVHAVYMRNLRDSGYNAASDFNAAGNMKTN